MTYASPKTLRARQTAAENTAAGKRTRKAQQVTIPTDEQWNATCDFHIEQIHTKAAYPDSVLAHARALVHMAIERRAAEIQRDLKRARWKATLIARHELLNSEIPSGEGCGDTPANSGGSFGKTTSTRISDMLIASGEF